MPSVIAPSVGDAINWYLADLNLNICSTSMNYFLGVCVLQILDSLIKFTLRQILKDFTFNDITYN